MEAGEIPVVAEPERWTLVFHTKAMSWWASIIACGHYKHVGAFAWIPALKLWLVYDVKFGGTQIAALPDGPEAKALLGKMIAGNDLMLMQRQKARVYFAPPLFCAGAISHLLRLPKGALRPDSLWRLCLEHGGEAVRDGTKRESGPRPASTAAEGRAG